ncbi:MAG TPA: sugar MFS transporter [Bacteroidia bacterium]|jgi:FHS family L-fucose permease-like MFS transporter|nr:sugar MFS transporter [Bacteroidia bacterium]HRG53455.1 sugar MFS transporter [Bacteroidia bacterium]
MEQKTNYSIPLAFITILYFMWGFITCLNDILIPHFKAIFVLSYAETMLIQFAFFGAYFIGSLIYFFISLSSGDPINRIGYKNGIILGLFISAVGTSLFYPAAAYQSFGFFLAALFVLALGFTILQIAANPFVILLGKPETGSHRLSLAGAINSFATTIAPIIGGALILGSAVAASDINSVKKPYLVLSGIFCLLIVVFKIVKLPSFSSEQKLEKKVGALAYPQLTLGILAIFFYVGAEVTVGSFMANFVGLKEIKGVAPAAATIYVSLYWGSLMIGRFAGAVSVFNLSTQTRKILTAVLPVATFFFILIIFKIRAGNQPFNISDFYAYLPFIAISIIAFYIGQEKPAKTLFLFSMICIVLLIVSLLTSGELAMWSVISLGLYNSIMWPAIFALAIAGLGKYTSQGSSLLIMAICGGALIPLIQGYIADHYSVHYSFIVPVFCYVYMAYYAWKMKSVLTAQGIEYDKPISAGH